MCGVRGAILLLSPPQYERGKGGEEGRGKVGEEGRTQEHTRERTRECCTSL